MRALASARYRVAMRTWIPISGLAVIALLAGCASYHPKPLQPEASLAALDERRLDNADLLAALREHHPQQTWPPTRWDLNSLTLAAAEIHPAIAQAQVEWQAAEAGVRIADARPNPQVGASGEHTTNAPAGQGPWTWGVSLEVPLETAGKRSARRQLAVQQVAVARARLDDTRWMLRAQIRDALLALSETRATQALLQEQVAAATARSQAQASRVTQGMAARPEQLAAEAQALDLQQQLDAATQAEADARQRLASAVGLTPAALADLSLNLPTTDFPPMPDARAMLAQALQQRADLQAALAEYAVSEARLRLEVAKQYPDLSLTPGYSWDAQSVTWSLGMGLMLPIFSHNQPAIAEAEADRQLARTRFEALQLTRRNAIEQTAAAEVAARRTLAQADDAASLAQRRLRAADTAFTAGISDRLQLLDVREADATVRQTALAARFSHARAVAALEDALQQPLSTFSDAATP